jgi:hypothetical protein
MTPFLYATNGEVTAAELARAEGRGYETAEKLLARVRADAPAEGGAARPRGRGRRTAKVTPKAPGLHPPRRGRASPSGTRRIAKANL